MKTQQISLNSEQSKKMKLKRKKRLAGILFRLKVFVLISLTIAILIFLGLSPLFNITGIEVKGNQHYPSDEIEKTTGIIIGSNGFKTLSGSLKDILTLRFGKSERALKESKTYIKQVTARYILPGTVRVTVLERKPLAAAEYQGKKIILDNEGYVLDTFPYADGFEDSAMSLTDVTVKDLSESTVKALPLLVGLRIKDYMLGQAVRLKAKSDTEAFNNAVELLTAITESDELTATDKLFEFVNTVDVSDQDNIILGFDQRFRVNFGHLQDMEHNLNFFRNIYYSVLKNSKNKGVLDMTAKDPVLKDE